MSAFLDQTRARVPRLVNGVRQRARLSVVDSAPTRAPRLPFAAFVLAVLGVGLVGLLMLNTSLQHQAFYARSLEQQAEDLAVRKQTLAMQVEALRAPDRLAREAQALGMLPNHSPAFLFLGDGTVRGEARPGDPSEALQLDPPPRLQKPVLSPPDPPRSSRDHDRD